MFLHFDIRLDADIIQLKSVLNSGKGVNRQMRGKSHPQHSQHPKQFRGGEKKVMKKSLSLLLAIAMVFSMFATVAAADELDTQAKFDILKEAGIFEGMPDGSAGLDQEMTRAQFAVIIYRLFEKTGNPLPDAQATFNDVSDTHWAAKEIGAVQNAGYMEGRGKGKFDPSAPVTKQELIKVVVDILGIEIDPEGTVSGNAKPWAQPYVAAAEKAGLVQPQEDYTVNALRGYLVDVTYSAYQQILGAQKVTATAKQTGAKKVEVTFSKPVDVSKATFAVKNGLADREVDKYTVSDDKKTVVLELTTRLQSAESTVTIKGVDSEDVVAKFTAEDERVARLKFKSNKLALKSLTDFTEVKVGYQLLNQFGEQATVSATPNFFVGKALATPSASNGVLTITVPSTNPFYLNEPVMISGHINMSNMYVVTFSETLTVGEPASLDSIEFKGVYHDDNKKLDTRAKFEDFYILIEAKDQYGNKLDATAVDNSAIVSVSNMTIFTTKGIVDNKGPNKDQVAIQLGNPVVTPGFDGTNTIRVQTYSGKLFTYDVQVPKASTVTKLALSAPSQVVASNDGSVKIPFVAEDQFGNRITKYSDLKGQIDPLQASLGNLQLKEDYVTKEGYLEYTIPSNLNNQYAQPVFLSVRVVNTNEIATVQFSIEKAWTPESISGLKDVNSDLALNSEVSIEPGNVVVKDNYGRNKNLDDLFAMGYKVVIEPADGTFDSIVATTDRELTHSKDKITFKAVKKGSERVKVQLIDTNVSSKVVHSYESFVFNVVDDNAFESYEVEDLPKISNKSAAHAVELKVYGKRSNGTKVLLPKDGAYSVTATNGLKVTGDGKISAEDIDDKNIAGDSTGELKATVVVTIFANAEVIEKEVVVTDEPLRVATIELQDVKDSNGNTLLKAENGVLKGAAGNINMANIFKGLKIKDQFGVEMNLAADRFNASFSNLTDYDGDGLTYTGKNGESANTLEINGVETGDSFTIVFTSKQTGVSIRVQVVAE
jgi:hypothetical protein